MKRFNMKVTYVLQYKPRQGLVWITNEFDTADELRRSASKVLDFGCQIRLFEKSIYLKAIEL